AQNARKTTIHCRNPTEPQIAAAYPKIRTRASRLPRTGLISRTGRGCLATPGSARGSAAHAMRTPAVLTIPARIKALRQPHSVPVLPRRNDSDAPIVKELVYHAAIRARIV